MIIIFIAIFTGTTINTINKLYVNSKTTFYEETNPTYYTVGTDDFLFAVGINGLNLNEGDRWFDVYMQYRSYGPDGRNKTYLPLKPCSKEPWLNINESFG